ncbi:MAG: OmpA family protein [Streptosporangiaceae bacterium]
MSTSSIRSSIPVALVLSCVVYVVAGCTFGGQVQGHGGPSVTLTEQASPSALVTVVPDNPSGQGLSRLVAATTRPRENIEIVRAGADARVLVAAQSPAAATLTIPGRPAAPGPDATSYQQATYSRNVAHWHTEVTSSTREVAVSTQQTLSAWVSALGVGQKMSSLPVVGATGSDLASECNFAVSALTGLEQGARDTFGGRRVLLLYASTLDSIPAAGELSGDVVIVVTPYLASAPAASAAQAALLGAGATWAGILGPETPAGQLDQLISAGLSHNVVTDALSGAALFANDSASLLPGAAKVLARLVVPLEKPGAAAVINGYASTPGSAKTNLNLSSARADAVADYLEAHGIAASRLIVVGHGATNLIAPGPSAANRRVVVVIEEPS